VPDVLSQSEIDALLSAMSSGDLDAAEMGEAVAAPAVRSFDFLRPSKFSKDQLRTIELLHEPFCRTSAAQLSAILRALVEVEVVSADQVSYGELVTSMPTPCLIHIVTLSPLEGMAVIDMDLGITFSIIDRLVGGSGTLRPKPRELTEIERALIQNVTDILLDAFSEAWSSVVPARFKVVGTEMNPQSAQIVTPTDMVMLITFELRVGSATGMLSLCIPYTVLEPAMEKLTAQNYFSTRTEISSPDLRDGIADSLGSVTIPVAVELGEASLSVGDLLALAPGDVIPLAVAPGSDATVRIGDRPAFHAQPGTRGRRSAVQVTSTIEDPERTFA
jgi:flagellar motor switch protein FliM